MDIAKRMVVYTLPGMEAVVVRREATMTTYGEGRAAVIIVNGYRDAGFEKFVGCKFMDMGWTTSWARLLAVSGLTAITYTTTDPEADLRNVIEHARARFDCVGLLATSGHGPLAVSMLSAVDFAALITPYTIDVPEAARAFGFVVPEVDVDKQDCLSSTFVARGGRDEMPGLNETLDRFVADALRRNAPLTLVNHASGVHSFDLFDETDESRNVVKAMLAWLATPRRARTRTPPACC